MNTDKSEVERLFREYQQRAPEPVTALPASERPNLQSVVFRLSSKRLEALKELSKRTRITPSVYLREAIEDVLKKHGVALALLLMLGATGARAEPFGPNTQLPGWGPNLSKALMRNGVTVVGNMAKALKRPLPTGRAFTCALATVVEGLVAINTVTASPPLDAKELASVQRVRDYLQKVQAEHCDRPSGGGPGTGNEGDKLVADAARALPHNRSATEEARAWVARRLEVAPDDVAVDVALVAAALLAGASAVPSAVLP